MSYVDGFVIPVPTDKKAAYREICAKAAEIFKEYGAERVVETWGDDVPDGKVTDFKGAVKAEAGENIVFSWIVWPSKEARDRGNEKMRDDPRMKMTPDMPFDGKRMIWGGFEVILDTSSDLQKAGPKVQKITPHLWYAKEAEEAAAFYASIFPGSRVDRVTALPSESPSGPAGSVKVVEFTLFGQPFMAISAGPLEPFNHAISFMVSCDDQAELDRYWSALLEGGSAEQCGWLKDKYGVSWQIVPTILGDLMTDPDPQKARRASDAMLKMVKLDIAGLKAAANEAG
jgi:predicted 3-demethylubiquinone-9 3-methyltransferase (glyoxalase superfamily)/uncharacterized protein YbaA (DUF1428 family)